MTELLYLKDSYQTEFLATITDQWLDPKKGYVVTLDRTAFYPTGGGQPHDIGTLNGVPVHSVEWVDDQVHHYVDSPIKENVVQGMIDWEHRFDFMQQHTGQHVMAAILKRMYDIDMEGFDIGDVTVTIDLKTKPLSNDQLFKIEQLANTIILKNEPIRATIVQPNALEAFDLVHDITREGDVRIVSIESFDDTPCGGTHLSSTGELQVIKLLGTERISGGARLSFVCGRRAVSHYALQHARIENFARLLETSDERIEGKLHRWKKERVEREKEIEQLKEQLLTYEATELWDGSGIVVRGFTERSIHELKALATILTKTHPHALVSLFTMNGSNVQLLATRGADHPLNLRDIASDFFGVCNGRGGGSPTFIQGAGTSEETMETLERNIASVLSSQRVLV